MAGKTFKGMTGEMLAWQTERLLELETHCEGHAVYVRPEQVVEVAIGARRAIESLHGRRGPALRTSRALPHRHVVPALVTRKTFKGMTDQMLTWQTERFTELATSPADGSSYVVQVRPEQVVEIAFDGVQRSTRYAGGMALRFARVVRYRDDKSAAEADTVDTVRALAAASGSTAG